MKPSDNRFVLGCLLIGISMGCTKIPCYSPDHYAPDIDATYTAEEVRIPNPQGHLLAGTLTIPMDSAPPYPAVILVTGSSPQDRDMLPHWSKPYCYFRPFRQIADTLSRGGMTVLRMDDQGFGCSQGGPLDKITIQGRAEDIFVGFDYAFNKKVSFFVGYRMLEGGADVDKVYNFTFLHYASAGLSVSL